MVLGQVLRLVQPRALEMALALAARQQLAQ